MESLKSLFNRAMLKLSPDKTMDEIEKGRRHLDFIIFKRAYAFYKAHCVNNRNIEMPDFVRDYAACAHELEDYNRRGQYPCEDTQKRFYIMLIEASA
jgi:hypothetical protein